jgi:3-hydroxybutyryl-CoA dehydrogenase
MGEKGIASSGGQHMDGSEIQRTAVVGGGWMGSGFAQIMATAGCQVWVMDVAEPQLETCLQRVRDGLSTFVEHEMVPADQVEPILARIHVTTSLETAVQDTQFVIEAVAEKLDVKQSVFESLDRLSPREAILATNTSGLKVTDIAARTQRPERVVGSHFFYPPALVPLVEVGYGERTSDETVETTAAFWRRCGKEPVVVRKDSNGFLVNRLQSALGREAMSMVANGVAGAVDVDRAIRYGLGIRMPFMGILEQRDWGGLDVHCQAADSIYPTLETSTKPLPIIADKVARGETGVKSGKGFYDWTGKDVDALRRKRFDYLIRMLKAVKEIMPEDEDLLENR